MNGVIYHSKANVRSNGAVVDVRIMLNLCESLGAEIEYKDEHTVRIDPTKIKNDLGWYPETRFEDGILMTIDWYLENDEWFKNVVSGAYSSYYKEMYGSKKEIK